MVIKLPFASRIFPRKRAPGPSTGSPVPLRSGEVPRLARGLELSGAAAGEGTIVASVPPERYFDLSPQAASLLSLIDGRRDLATLARLHSAQIDRAVSVEDLSRLIQEKYRPAGLVVVGEEEPSHRRPRSRLWVRVPLLRPGAANPLGGAFTFLFRRPLAWVLLAVAAAVQLAFFAVRPSASLDGSWLAPTFWAGPLLLYYGSSLWHELGHVAALRRFGERSGDVGIGMYRFLPVFFSDVSRSWVLGRWSRLVVDLGGMYFQLLSASAVAAVALVRPAPELSRAVILIDMAILFNLNPFLRMDGYWIAEDLSGNRHLRRRSAGALRTLFRPRPGSPQASPFVRIYALASTVYFLFLMVGLVGGVAPRILGQMRDLLAGKGLGGAAPETAFRLGIGVLVLIGITLLLSAGAKTVREILGRAGTRRPAGE